MARQIRKMPDAAHTDPYAKSFESRLARQEERTAALDGTLANLKQAVDELSHNVSKIGKPNYTVIIGAITMAAGIVSYLTNQSLSPILFRLDMSEASQREFVKARDADSSRIVQLDKDLSHVSTELAIERNRQVATQSDMTQVKTQVESILTTRFTAENGARLAGQIELLSQRVGNFEKLMQASDDKLSFQIATVWRELFGRDMPQ